MAVTRSGAWISQQRIDVPHLRSLESGVQNDFDLSMGNILGGKSALVINGFTLAMSSSTIGSAVTSLVLNTAGAKVLHYLASDAGSIFEVPADRVAETLTSTNTRITGSFTASATNYIGIDLIRTADTTTTDLVTFIDPNTDLETTRSVPLAKTLDYQIIISTVSYNSLTNSLPIAMVVTDANNNITSIKDVRQMFWRLGSGGVSASALNVYSWANSRTENVITTTSGNPTNNPFTATDKSFASLKAWTDAAMTRLWELGGGEHWYSPTADRNIAIVLSAPTGTMTDNVETTGALPYQIRWSGISFVFDNSTSYYNTVTDSNAYGATTINNGQCLYVDLNRATNGPLTAAVGTLISLGTPTPSATGSGPGNRFIIAWCYGGVVYVRNRESWVKAGTTHLGVVRTLTDVGVAGPAVGDLTDPVVPIVDDVSTRTTSTAYTYRSILAGGLTRGITSEAMGAGVLRIGTGSSDTSIVMGVAGANTTTSITLNSPSVVLSRTGAGNITVDAAASNQVLAIGGTNNVTYLDGATNVNIGRTTANNVTIGRSGMSGTVLSDARQTTIQGNNSGVIDLLVKSIVAKASNATSVFEVQDDSANPLLQINKQGNVTSGAVGGTAGNFIYGATQTKSLVLDTRDFHVYNTNDTTVGAPGVAGYSTSGFMIANTAHTTTGSTGVHLPNGATIGGTFSIFVVVTATGGSPTVTMILDVLAASANPYATPIATLTHIFPITVTGQYTWASGNIAGPVDDQACVMRATVFADTSTSVELDYASVPYTYTTIAALS